MIEHVLKLAQRWHDWRKTESYFARHLAASYRKGLEDAHKGETIAPVTEGWTALFQPGELIPLKHLRFEVGGITNEGLMLRLVGVCSSGRKIAKRVEAEKAKAAVQ